MRSFNPGDRVVVKKYSPYWNDQAGVVLEYKGGFYIIGFDDFNRGTGGFSSKYLELVEQEGDFVEDLV